MARKIEVEHQEHQEDSPHPGQCNGRSGAMPAAQRAPEITASRRKCSIVPECSMKKPNKISNLENWSIWNNPHKCTEFTEGLITFRDSKEGIGKFVLIFHGASAMPVEAMT